MRYHVPAMKETQTKNHRPQTKPNRSTLKTSATRTLFCNPVCILYFKLLYCPAMSECVIEARRTKPLTVLYESLLQPRPTVVQRHPCPHRLGTTSSSRFAPDGPIIYHRLLRRSFFNYRTPSPVGIPFSFRYRTSLRYSTV